MSTPLLVLLPLSAALSAFASSLPAAVVTANPPEVPIQIVTLRGDVDVDELINQFQLKPRHVYRQALKDAFE